MPLLFLKAHVKGYVRKDGVVVKDHVTKVHAKVKPATTAQWPGWNTKAPLNLSDTPAPVAVPAHPDPKKTAKVIGASQGWGLQVAQGGFQDSPHGSASPKPSKAVVHPQKGEDGKDFKVYEPSTASSADSWADPDALAVFVPDGKAPAELNGVALAPWRDHPRTIEGWDYVPGQLHDLDEPEMALNGKEPAAGVVIEEPDGRVWMVKPSNAFAGYVATFPKGHADDGLSMQATAIKEAFEESGLQVEITGLVGDVERSSTVTRYFRARRVGGTPTAMGWESQAVMLAPKSAVHAELNRAFDRTVASMSGIASPAGLLESADDWHKTGKATGTNPGGFYTDRDGQPWYVKVPRSPAVAKNEILAAHLYQAAGVAVPELKSVTVAGKPAVASKIVPGLAKLTPGAAGVMDGFAVDAWLANWDVVGLAHDNLLEDPAGRAIRVDVGGSLLFRAQGELKGKHFGNEVGELETLTNGMNPQSEEVFGSITHAELLAGIAKVASVPVDTIRAAVEDYGPGTAEQRKSLANTLIARRAYLLALAG